MLHQNQTSYLVKLLAQRKVSIAQPSSPRIRHPELYVYTFLSSYNIFSSTLPSPIQNLRTKFISSFASAFRYPLKLLCSFQRQTSQFICQCTLVLICHTPFYTSTQLLLAYSPPNPPLLLFLSLNKTFFFFLPYFSFSQTSSKILPFLSFSHKLSSYLPSFSGRPSSP